MNNSSVMRDYLVAMVYTGILFVVFFTYRSFEPKVLYLNWLAGVTAIIIYFFNLLIGGKLSKHFVVSLLTCSAWLLFGIFITPYATNTITHIKIWLVSAFYVVASLVIVDILFRTKADFKKTAYKLLWLWVVINGILLLHYVYGANHQIVVDFSGVFHDRNVFSITTLIICAFCFGSSYKAQLSNSQKMMLRILLLSSGVMIILSRSVTGFFGGSILLLISSANIVSTLKRSLYLTIVVTVVLLMLFVDNPIKNRSDRFYLAITGQQELLHENESAYIRTYLLKEGLNLAKDNLIFGVGFDNARYHIIPPGFRQGRFLHNNYIDIITSGGLLLFLLYYGPIAAAFYWLTKKKRVIKTNYKEYLPLWRTAYLFLILKIIYDLTWTTYFEFGMTFSVVFAIYTTYFLMTLVNESPLG